MTATTRRRRPLAAVTVTTFGVLLLAAGTLLGSAMYDQVGQLRDRVADTERIAEANVRTLSQTQRELLGLRYLLATEAPAERVLLQASFVTQRTQESALSYQRNTLGTEELLDQARAARRTWLVEVLPQVRAAVAGDGAAGSARSSAVADLDVLESTYNTLVSEGEINRRAQAARANDASQTLLGEARRLFLGLVALVVLAVVSTVAGGVLLVRSSRQRAAANARLVDLNRELETQAQVVHATDSMVMVTDARGVVEWVNEAFARDTGYALDEVRGRRPGDVLQGPGTDARVVADMGAALGAGQPFRAELANYRASGEEFWVALDISPLRDEHGTITGWVGVQSDVTERHQAQLLLEQATRDAEDSARDKAAFLATMSHEIRTPLNAVLGLTELLLLTELDTEQADYAETAHRSGQHLLALVNDVLDYSALEAGRLDVHEEEVDLPELVGETLRMFAGQAEARGISLVCSSEPSVPTRVLGDAVRLRQVLVNLVGNALKFTEQGAVVVTLACHQGRLRLRVTDEGIGIPAWRIPGLFHSFVRGDLSTTRKYGGTGLGLAISRRLVEQMGGEIDLVSQVDVGTTVTLTLPVRVPVTVARDPQAASDGLPDLGDLRVLVAEDDRVNQTVVVRMLQRLGVEAVVTDNGREAVDRALGGDFDVVLLDVQMPVMDGLEAVRLLRRAALPREPWVVALTANALPEDRARFLASGMDDHLSKPLTLEALASALGRARGPRGAERSEVAAPQRAL